MAIKKRSRGNPVPLLREDHPADYVGYPFITLIQYQHDPLLVIVDDSDEKKVSAYVLDLCGPESVDEETIISIAADWFDANAQNFPLSFEFSRRGLADVVSTIHRTYSVDFITRVIGPLPMFSMNTAPTIKRRKRKPIPPGMEVHIVGSTLITKNAGTGR
jgi:hypothetical protein